jgi:hypothetical protein
MRQFAIPGEIVVADTTDRLGYCGVFVGVPEEGSGTVELALTESTNCSKNYTYFSCGFPGPSTTGQA